MNSKVKSKRASTISVLILAFLFTAGCKPQVSKDTEQLILDMRNSDVKWDGNFVGLMPMSFNGATLALQNVEEPIEPLLLEAILDEDRYVAAHVLLTFRAKTNRPFIMSADNWNGLHVQLLADGTATYEGNDLDALHQQWIKELADKAH